MRQAARQRAKAILQADLPEYIAHLDDLLEQQSKDHSSPLWEGHLESGPFVKEHIKLLLEKGVESAGHATSYGSPSSDAVSQDLKNGVSMCARKTGEEVGNAEADEETSVQSCWKGHLPPNEVCDRLSELVQK